MKSIFVVVGLITFMSSFELNMADSPPFDPKDAKDLISSKDENAIEERWMGKLRVGTTVVNSNILSHKPLVNLVGDEKKELLFEIVRYLENPLNGQQRLTSD